MLDILLIKKTQDFFSHYADQMEDDLPIIITPNPDVADSVRKRFDTLGRSVESMTISGYIKQLINQLEDPTLLDNYKGKSELLTLLGAIWKKIGKDNLAEFMKAFNLLTEFRSFSMSSDVLETVLENYDPEVSASVLWLHRFLEQLEVVDEHRSYFLIAEKLREGAIPVDFVYGKKIVFFGFDFMTASQVDMLKAIAIRDAVCVPFYEKTWQISNDLDWIKWLAQSDSKIINITKEYKTDLSVTEYEYAKNYLGKYLIEYKKDHSDFDVMLGLKRLDLNNTLELPFEELNYKISIDIFEAEIETVYADLRGIIKNESTTLAVVEQLKVKVQTTLVGQYKLLKCYLMFMSKLSEWNELSGENETLSQFDIDLLFEVLKLDLPRLNAASMNNSQSKAIGLWDLRSLDLVKDAKVVFALNSNHGSVKSSGSSYSENVEKYLASIGPIRRAELELTILAQKFQEFVDDNQVTFFIEAGLFEHDSSWGAVTQGIERKKTTIDIDFKKETFFLQKKPETHPLSKISASKLQTYIDCPQKYYYKYIEKLSPDIFLEKELTVLELGRIQHEVIEKYFTLNPKLSFEDIIERTLNKYLVDKIIKKERLAEYRIEISAYCFGIIKKLEELQNVKGFTLKFEFPFKIGEDILFNGSIDCFCYHPEKNIKIILDFKRSNRLFTSYSSILELTKVQLWFYLERLKELGAIGAQDKLLFGYVDLSELENSTFFSSSEEASDVILDLGFTNRIKLIDDLLTIQEEYRQFEQNTISKLKLESDFYPKPIKNDVCEFCHIKNICSRGER